MKAHIGLDAESGLAHTLETTPANASDVTVAHALLHGGEAQVQGDAGYEGVGQRAENRDADVDWQVAMKPGKRRLLDKDGPEEAAEKRKASVRAKVEHPFLYVKRHFGYAKVRYRGAGEEHAAHHPASRFGEPADRGNSPATGRTPKPARAFLPSPPSSTHLSRSVDRGSGRCFGGEQRQPSWALVGR